MVKRTPFQGENGGSIPPWVTKYYGVGSSVGRVGDCESLGRGFEPRPSPQIMGPVVYRLERKVFTLVGGVRLSVGSQDIGLIYFLNICTLGEI